MIAGQQQYPFQGLIFERLEGSGYHLEIFVMLFFSPFCWKFFSIAHNHIEEWGLNRTFIKLYVHVSNWEARKGQKSQWVYFMKTYAAS